jgi:hypothetical protein
MTATTKAQLQQKENNTKMKYPLLKPATRKYSLMVHISLTLPLWKRGKV